MNGKWLPPFRALSPMLDHPPMLDAADEGAREPESSEKGSGRRPRARSADDAFASADFADDGIDALPGSPSAMAGVYAGGGDDRSSRSSARGPSDDSGKDAAADPDPAVSDGATHHVAAGLGKIRVRGDSAAGRELDVLDAAEAAAFATQRVDTFASTLRLADDLCGLSVKLSTVFPPRGAAGAAPGRDREGVGGARGGASRAGGDVPHGDRELARTPASPRARRSCSTRARRRRTCSASRSSSPRGAASTDRRGEGSPTAERARDRRGTPANPATRRRCDMSTPVVDALGPERGGHREEPPRNTPPTRGPGPGPGPGRPGVARAPSAPGPERIRGEERRRAERGGRAPARGAVHVQHRDHRSREHPRGPPARAGGAR